MIGNWKQQTYRDPAYLQFIREQTCCVPICRVTPCNPHHLNMKGTHSGGMALKTSDYRTIPLCSMHHGEYHALGRTSMEQRYHIDFREILIDILEEGMHCHINGARKG